MIYSWNPLPSITEEWNCMLYLLKYELQIWSLNYVMTIPFPEIYINLNVLIVISIADGIANVFMVKCVFQNICIQTKCDTKQSMKYESSVILLAQILNGPMHKTQERANIFPHWALHSESVMLTIIADIFPLSAIEKPRGLGWTKGKTYCF